MSDVCRKSFFTLEPQQKDLLRDGSVDVKTFWSDLLLNIAVNDGIENLLPRWSGYVNPELLNDQSFLSNDVGKGRKSSIAIEDSTILNTEDIMNTIANTQVTKVIEVMKSCGIVVNSFSSKHELMQTIQSHLGSSFAFSKKNVLYLRWLWRFNFSPLSAWRGLWNQKFDQTRTSH